MKHASAAALLTIPHLLAALRCCPALTERKPGVFYRKSTAFVHFHEDASGMFADVHRTGGWERMPVNSKVEVRKFFSEIQKKLGKRP